MANVYNGKEEKAKPVNIEETKSECVVKVNRVYGSVFQFKRITKKKFVMAHETFPLPFDENERGKTHKRMVLDKDIKRFSLKKLIISI